MNELDVQNEWEKKKTHTHTHTHQYSHRLQFKITETSATSFCTRDFDHRCEVDFDLPTSHGRFDLHAEHSTPYHLQCWYPWIMEVCVTTHWCYRRTHLVRGNFTVSTSEVVLAATSTRRFPQQSILVLYQIPPPLTFPKNLCCSRSAVVRHGHPVNHKMCLAPRRGASRVMTKCNGIIFKNSFQ